MTANRDLVFLTLRHKQMSAPHMYSEPQNIWTPMKPLSGVAFCISVAIGALTAEIALKMNSVDNPADSLSIPTMLPVIGAAYRARKEQRFRISPILCPSTTYQSVIDATSVAPQDAKCK